MRKATVAKERKMFTEGTVGEWLVPDGGTGEPLKVLSERMKLS